MKSTLTFFFLLLLFTAGAQETTPYFQSGKVYFMTPIPDAHEGKANRLASLITKYFDAVEKNDLVTWKSCFSDSTLARVEQRKFQPKLERVRGYGMRADTIRIVQINKLAKPSSNEVGTEYELIIDFGMDLNVENRVSFDCIKGSEEHANPRLFGINVVMIDKVYAICEHKYIIKNEEEGTGGGDGNGQD